EDLTGVLGQSLDATVAEGTGDAPSGDDLVVGLDLVPSSKMKWSGKTGNAASGDQGPGVSTHLGGGPERIAVHAESTRWSAVAATAALVVVVFVGLVAVGILMRRRANR